MGDIHLSALLRVHGAVMSGGANHAAETCTPQELARAVEASRYFGLTELSDVIQRLPEAADDDEAERRLDEKYGRLVPTDSVLADAFERRFALTPGDFEPLIAP